MINIKAIRNALCDNTSDLSAGWRAFLASQRPAAIYGAGRQATVVFDFCKMLGKPCEFLLTKNSRERWGMLPREDTLPLYLLDAFPKHMDKTDYDIIVAVNPKYNCEITSDLQRHGWQHIYTSENWESDNAASRSIFFHNYLLQHGAFFEKDADGNEILCYQITRSREGEREREREFVMYYDLDKIYQTALLGDMGNIIAPSLFGDISLTGAYGPCEYGPVRLSPGDVVLDLGACIGEFSCVAAAKGCTVHAFEPTPETVEKYLSPNAALYDTITVVGKAVSDNNGISTLYINNAYSESCNITRNSVFRHLEPLYAPVSIETITIDSYVEANYIPKIDFIKSHTEYSELKAFAGAARTIRKFCPKLCYWGSIYAKELEELLLSLNPAYRFDYTWGNKIFAWVDA